MRKGVTSQKQPQNPFRPAKHHNRAFESHNTMAAEVMPNLTVEGGGNGNGHRKVRSSSMIWKQSATNSNPSSPALSAQPARAVSPSSLAPPGVKIKRRKWQPECRPVCDRPPRFFQRAGWHFLLSWQQFRRKNKPGERTTAPCTYQLSAVRRTGGVSSTLSGTILNKHFSAF